MTFNEYLALFAEYEENGIYLHYLIENESRYNNYLNLNPDITESTAYANVNVNADFDSYDEIRFVPDLSSVSLLVSSRYRLPEDWIPDDLVDVYYNLTLRDEAAEAFLRMRDAIEDIGLRLHIVSAFRSYDRQNTLHYNAVINYGLENADKEVARAGHSEHQTGLAVDILNRAHSGRLEYAQFHDTEEFAWLIENAHIYGFILRYPQEYAHTYGYLFEPWHWRYVGTAIATAMLDTDISVFDEFYGKYLSSDVLYNVMNVMLEQRILEEAAEIERREEEIRLQTEAEAAARAALEAELAAIEAEKAALAKEIEDSAALQRAISDSLLMLNDEKAAERAAAENRTVIFAITGLLTIAFIFYFILLLRK